MPYSINGTEITVQPTTGRWVQRYMLGRTGAANPIYPAVREYELRWQLTDQLLVQQIFNFFNSINYTGTAVVSLPQYGSPSGTYTFKSYSGCVLDEPDINTYFTEHSTDIVWNISNIVT